MPEQEICEPLKAESGHSSEAKTVFIVNRTAGSGKCAELFEQARRFFDGAGLEYSVKTTEYEGHATQLAKAALLDGAKRLVAVGGDGTVREVASALFGADSAVLGILPFGTGNDFAAAVGIPTEPQRASELILKGEASFCDLGRANDRLFMNVCGLGFDVEVLKRVEKHKKGRSGMLPYALGIVSALLHRKKIRAHIRVDDGEEMTLDALLITACNGKRFGGGMLVAPNAEADDGLFDICIADWLGFFRMITLLPLFIKGKHTGRKEVRCFRARTLRIRTEGECTVETDGELIEKTPLELELIPRALRLIRP